MRRVVLLAPAAAAITLFQACGGSGSDNGNLPDLPEEEEARHVAGIAELATNAYATAGVSGLYDYLSPDVLRQCSIEEIAAELGGRPVPAAYRSIEDIEFENGRATAGVVQAFGEEEERRMEWAFRRTEDGAWRVASIPGLERCGN